MKKYILALFLTLFAFSAFSQKLYFIYLQTENEQPFFVRLNEKVQSSTASGYLILSKLRDTTYNLALGFPQNKWPEQQFTLQVGRKDHGYLVKNFGEKGWGLFDLQTLEVIMPIAGKSASTNVINTEASGFTTILSRAADDPSLKEKPAPSAVVTEEKTVTTAVVVPAKAEAEVKTTITPEVPVKTEPVVVKEEKKETKNEVPTAKNTEPAAAPVNSEPQPTPPVASQIQPPLVTEPVKEEPKAEIKETAAPVEAKVEEIKPVQPEDYKMSTVIRRSESSTTEGFGLVFLDKYENGMVDTVRLMIPNPRSLLPSVKEEPREEKKMLDIPVEAATTDTNSAIQKPTQSVTLETKSAPLSTTIPTSVTADTVTLSRAAKNNCQEVAAENDFFKLRKAMAAAENDEDMTGEARKYFKLKCFTTLQVKNLGTLFLTDQGKYQFFDLAYTHITDPENYNQLQAELKEEYYVNRFKAMLRN
ncbi:MAG: DUF4476 domain-containing protein [Bacteroidetes bacterium]|nr:DUF4476 domain-containing protein [Bacteroidota bacterium]